MPKLILKEKDGYTWVHEEGSDEPLHEMRFVGDSGAERALASIWNRINAIEGALEMQGELVDERLTGLGKICMNIVDWVQGSEEE